MLIYLCAIATLAIGGTVGILAYTWIYDRTHGWSAKDIINEVITKK